MSSSVILNTFPLDFQWATQEPFLFCVHHFDFYPPGQDDFGPEKKYLKGRDIGQDFTPKDGFRMYHGETVPGFPVHPHRGFETITIVRKGYVDHADSLGAAGRYGEGDVQWMTAGAGVQHSEMFPLLKKEQENTVELFQIWLNLPRKNKMAAPYFKMFWSQDIPSYKDSHGLVTASVIAGTLQEKKALAPPPDSWAVDLNNEVVILLLKIKKDGQFLFEKSKGKTNRTIYFFSGSEILVNDESVSAKQGLIVSDASDITIKATQDKCEILVLQARPIGEPVFQHGPFVMNSKEDIIRTIEDYRKTEFGGWSWPRLDMIHGSKIERFAKYPDGKIEKP